MPKTRASARRSTRLSQARRDTATSDDDSVSVRHPHEDTEVGPGMSVMDHLSEVRSGVEELNARIASLERENRSLKSELRRVQQNTHSRTRGGGSALSEKASQRQIRLLERKIINLKAAHEKDRRTIEKLRDTEVQQDAKELADDDDGTMLTQQTTDLGESAIKLLRNVCDAIDMNTLAEGEECAICMEEMAAGKCYSLRCRHPVCAGCFERLGDGSSAVSNCQTESVQCPHCREVCLREECDIITHTAVQQWDLLLDVSRKWVTIDTSEIDIGEDDDEDSFIDDGSVAATESPRVTETIGEAADSGAGISAASSPLNNTGPVAYKSLPSPLKRKRLSELVAQRSVRQRV